jgi:hypothetical protein
MILNEMTWISSIDGDSITGYMGDEYICWLDFEDGRIDYDNTPDDDIVCRVSMREKYDYFNVHYKIRSVANAKEEITKELNDDVERFIATYVNLPMLISERRKGIISDI